MMRLRIELKNKEIELLEAQQRARPSNSYVSTSDDVGNSSAFSVTLCDVKCLLPKMTDSGDVVDFLQCYEKVLILQNVDKSLWHQLLPGQLAPKALKVFSALSLEQSCSCDEIKIGILNSCKRSEATYPQNFMNLRRSGAMSYEEHFTRLRDSYSKYLDALLMSYLTV